MLARSYDVDEPKDFVSFLLVLHSQQDRLANRVTPFLERLLCGLGEFQIDGIDLALEVLQYLKSGNVPIHEV